MNELTKIDDTFDKIEQYYRSSGKLSDKEHELCSRWELAFALLCEHRNKKIAVTKYISAQSTKGLELSVATAYRDFENAQNLFVPLKKYSKEFLRLILIESSIRDVKECERMLKKSRNIKDWSEIMKAKDKAELRIIKSAGLDVDDPNMPDFSKLALADININIDPQMKSMFTKLLKRGTVDVTQLFYSVSDATIVDHPEKES